MNIKLIMECRFLKGIIGLVFGALVLDIWSANTSPKALLGIGWTALLLIGLFFAEKNEKK
jgi:hypothetical protein